MTNQYTKCSSPDQKKLGTLLELRGQGWRQMESILLGRGDSWFNFLNKCLDAGGVMKRLDLAINDMVDMLDIPSLIKKIQVNECISVMREYEGITSGRIFHEEDEDFKDETGTTLYIGSTKSEPYFCLYEKVAEQAKKSLDTDIRNRFEIRLKNERAAKARWKIYSAIAMRNGQFLALLPDIYVLLIRKKACRD